MGQRVTWTILGEYVNDVGFKLGNSLEFSSHIDMISSSILLTV